MGKKTKLKTPKLKPKMMDVRGLGRTGGLTRAENLTPERRSEIARHAVQTRWAAKKKKPARP